MPRTANQPPRLKCETSGTYYTPAGVRRRLRALARMGISPKQVAYLLGEDTSRVQRWMDRSCAPAYVMPSVDKVFETLSFTVGPDELLAARARRAGWGSPMAWYGRDMEGANAKPYPDVAPSTSQQAYPLVSQIFQALMGIVGHDDLARVELRSVVRILHRRGWSDRRIAAWLRWHTDDLDKGSDAVNHVRTRAKIYGFGLKATDDHVQEHRNGLIVVPSAA
jgi:hypothetical protein